jgi:hypothetical protein
MIVCRESGGRGVGAEVEVMGSMPSKFIKIPAMQHIAHVKTTVRVIIPVLELIFLRRGIIEPCLVSNKDVRC